MKVTNFFEKIFTVSDLVSVLKTLNQDMKIVIPASNGNLYTDLVVLENAEDNVVAIDTVVNQILKYEEDLNDDSPSVITKS